MSQDLQDFPDCATIVAELVLFYSELEVLMLLPVASALNASPSQAIRIIYRARSEAHRLDIADAAMRPFFRNHGLEAEFAQWLGAMRHCKNIRNQYAHALWARRNDELFFNNLDEVAKSEPGPWTEYHIDISLLKQQERFVIYAIDCALYLNDEAARLRDRRRRHKSKMPKPLPRPKLYNRRG